MIRIHALIRYFRARRAVMDCALRYALNRSKHGRSSGWRDELCKQVRVMVLAKRTMRTGREIQ